MIFAPHAIVLCEGFHDRAFWKGWLTLHGCTETRQAPWGAQVSRGQFGFTSAGGRFLRVIPGGGDPQLLEVIEPELRQRATRPVSWFLVSIDSDLLHDADAVRRAGRVRHVVERFRKVGDVAEVAPGHYRLDDGTNLGVVLWEAHDPPHAELPSKQTLERLACAALRAVHPTRSAAVAQWLISRPEPGGGGCDPSAEKAYAWSHMAGWYAEHACDEFYQRLWRDDALAAALEDRLRPQGALELVRALIT